MRVRYSYTFVVTDNQWMLTPSPPPPTLYAAKAGIPHMKKKYNPILPLG